MKLAEFVRPSNVSLECILPNDEGKKNELWLLDYAQALQ